MSSGLGIDIEEVYDELGISVEIVGRSPSTTEKLLHEVNAQGTKPFIREHHLDCSFPYNTTIVVGDVLKAIATNRYYMVMNLTPELFEDEIIENSGVIYLCNIPNTAHIVRPIDIRSSVSYDMVAGWQVIYDSPIYGLISDRVFGSEIDPEIDEGQVQNWRIDLYLPKSYDIKPLDRLIVSSGEYYKIEVIEAYNYPGVNVVLLTEDTRPETVFILDEYGDEDVYEDEDTY